MVPPVIESCTIMEILGGRDLLFEYLRPQWVWVATGFHVYPGRVNNRNQRLC